MFTLGFEVWSCNSEVLCVGRLPHIAVCSEGIDDSVEAHGICPWRAFQAGSNPQAIPGSPQVPVKNLLWSLNRETVARGSSGLGKP